MGAINGTGSSGFPEGQCTRYADDRYHALTGFYVPWRGNANQWAAAAPGFGWTVSSKPVVPSIICLQGGTQGADSAFGHVGIVESINSGTVTTTSLNWGPNPSVPATVNFVVGPGVSFIYATGSNGKPLGDSSPTLSDIISNAVSGGNGGSIALSPNADVTNFLWTADKVLALTNPFDVQAQNDTINAAGISVSFVDPVSWVESVGTSLYENLVAIEIRGIFLVIGVIVLMKVMSAFIDFGQVSSTLTNGLKTVAEGSALLA